MIRLKHFAFIAVIVIATLLVVGNWVTPVHANNAGIVTPMPTSTPVTKLDNPGETSSKEQQEELKSVIQSYFEIRYQALSVSPQPNGFQLDGFGELVSDGFEAKAFLDEELGKLAFEIKHAELNHLRYAEYKYFLDFRNITVDTSTQIATISVIEENAFIDEISIEFDPKNPFVSHSYNLEHTIVLRKEQNRWKIVSDNYTDYLWRMLRQTGKSTDELLRAMKAVPRLTSQGVSAATAFTCNLPADASTHLYNRDDVVSYALAHVAREDYNPDYPDYNSGDDALPWGDCTNFVSQAMYEGGNASMAMLSSLPQPNPGGQVGWYLLNDRQRASAWSDVDKLHEFILDPISTPSAGWTEGPEGCDTTINNLMLGDVIQYDWTGNGTWDHAAVVVNFVGADPYVATHTPDGVRHYTAFSPSYDPNLTQIRFIHIERSDGNPPVKTEITSASDDWGPNLYNCTSSSTNNNEIYFGACANGGSAPSGFRFNNIQIPQGAQIKYAYVNFTVDGPYGVAGSPISYPIAPISVNIYEGSNTNIVVPWNIDGNSSVPYDTWDWKDKRTTPNIQSIIQNTIRGSGWGNGNPLSIIFANNGSSNMRRVMAFDRIYYQPALYGYSPAKLIVAYDLPVGSPPMVLSITRASANPTVPPV